MRYIGSLLFMVFINCAFAQDAVFTDMKSSQLIQIPQATFLYKPDLTFRSALNSAKLYSVSTTNSFFNKSYLIGKNGEVFSNSFMATSNFIANDNLIVFSGQNLSQRDSFNPYGAYDMTSMIILSTFNTFISKIKIRRR